MNLEGLAIRGTHLHSFRTGQWARVLGAVWTTPGPGLVGRAAWVAGYPDGTVDYVALQDRENYELAPVASVFCE